MANIKYNYDGTIDLLKRVADTTHVITRTELIQSLTNGNSTDCPKTALASALKNLRSTKLDKLGIIIECPHGERRKGRNADYRVYHKPSDKTEARVESKNMLSALERDNQRLFVELEELKAQYALLQEELEAHKEREKKHLILIETYHALVLGA